MVAHWQSPALCRVLRDEDKIRPRFNRRVERKPVGQIHERHERRPGGPVRLCRITAVRHLTIFFFFDYSWVSKSVERALGI